jgi:hyperosmotically inducible periplasmic protein
VAALRVAAYAHEVRRGRTGFDRGPHENPRKNSIRMKTSSTLLCLILGLVVGGAFVSGCSSTSTRESTGEYIDSSTLTAKVKSALVSDEMVKARDVQVETFRGTVQLSGFVDSEAQKERATAVARSVQGVQDVKNNLIVK